MTSKLQTTRCQDITLSLADTTREEDVVAEIKQLHADAIVAAKLSLTKVIRIGEILCQAKSRLSHGGWSAWLKANIPFSERTARNYMRCYERREAIKTETVSDLTGAYKLLRAPKPAITCPPPRSNPKAVVDKTGFEIPTGILPGWQAAQATACELVDKTKKFLACLEQEKTSQLLTEIDRTYQIATLNSIIADFKRIFPYAVCHSCKGESPTDIEGKPCPICKWRGFYSEFFWRNCVSEDIRNSRGV